MTWETDGSQHPFIDNGSRREYRKSFKAQVVEECLQPGKSVSAVARRHDINANMVFRWRREYRLGIIRPSNHNPGTFVSVGVIDGAGRLASQAAPPIMRPALQPKTKSAVVKGLPGPTAPSAPVGTVELHMSRQIE